MANKNKKNKKVKNGKTAAPEPVCDANGENCCCPTAVAAKAVEAQNDAAKKTAKATKKADHAAAKGDAKAAKQASHDEKKEAH